MYDTGFSLCIYFDAKQKTILAFIIITVSTVDC